jgi:hypothetical protein
MRAAVGSGTRAGRSIVDAPGAVVYPRHERGIKSIHYGAKFDKGRVPHRPSEMNDDLGGRCNAPPGA